MAGVRIPIIGQETSVPVSSPTPHATAVPVNNYMGQALEKAAGAMVNVSHAVAWQQEQDAKAWTTNALPDITLKAQEELQKRKESAAEGATNFTPEYTKWFDEFQQKSLEAAPDAASKKYLGQHLASLRTSLTSSALGFEAQARQDWRANEYSKGVDKWAKLVAADPSQYDVAMTALNETMPDVTPAQKIRLREIAEKSLRVAAGSTAVINDPRTTLQQVDGVLGTHSRKLTTEQATAAGVKADAMPLALAIFGQESSGGKADTSKPNIDGALGPMQITKPTWETFQKRGVIPADWKWDDQKQNKDAGFRIVQFYADKYNGDVEKVAAAYFGGEGAINADGSINRDRKDSNGKTVGSYVDDIKRRVGGGTTKLAAADSGTMTDVSAGTAGRVSTPPWMASMTVGELLQVRQHAESQIQQVSQQAQSQLRLATQNAEAQAAAGVAPTDAPKTRADFQQAFTDATVAEHEFQRYSTARETATAVAGYKNRSTEELVGILDGKSAQRLFPDSDANDPNFAVHENRRKIAESAAAQVIRARQEDPWAYAIQNHEFGATTVDPKKDDFAVQLAARASNLPGLMQKYGVGPALLSKPEASALAQQFAALPADQRVGLLTKIRDAVRDDGIYSNLMNSIRKDSPVTAMVGNIAAVGGTIQLPSGAASVTDVARRIAIGEDLLNKTKAAKGEDGNKGNFPMPGDRAMRQKWNDEVGAAYAGFPDAEAHAFEAYRAYYAAVAAEKGLKPAGEKDINDQVAMDAITAATGGVTKWGSFGSRAPIILPYGMNSSEFKDKVAGTWQRVGPENGYTKTDIASLGLKPTGQNGVYQVMSGTSWLPGKDGEPIMLDLNHYQYPPAKQPAAPADGGRLSVGTIRSN